MSYTTIADEHKNSARDDIQSAIENLSEIVVNKCSGEDEYRKEYLQDLRGALFKLMEARDLIK